MLQQAILPASIRILEDSSIKPTEDIWADLANSPNPMWTAYLEGLEWIGHSKPEVT